VPELPEVELAARVARAACAGKRLVAVRTLHASARRHLPPSVAATLAGDRVSAVRRRGKHQLLMLDSGRTLHVHFRMTGDWRVTRAGGAPEPLARLLLDFDDGTRLALVDPRALAVATLHAPGIDPLPALGPEATDRQFNATWLRRALEGRRGAIKPALLDQRLVAGVGNIYAAEALWHARLDPRTPCAQLDHPQLAAIVAAIKRVLRRALAHPERYYGADGASDRIRFSVYDREGGACPRCRAPIERIVQAARSTYRCPRCQG